MEPYAIAIWGKWNADEARARSVDNIREGITQVIEADGERAGILRVERSPDFIDLKQVFILAPFQRRGIGAKIILGLIEEARTKGLPIKLRVLTINPARELYERLGFSVGRSTAEHHYMEYR